MPAELSLGWKKVPPFIKLFLLKGLLFFVLWKALYLFLLLPHRVLDAPMTYTVSMGTTKALNFLDASNTFSSKAGVYKNVIDEVAHNDAQMDIFASGKLILSIADGCNGLELFILYAGFIICLPASLWRKAIFLFFGSLMIFLVNILRCAILTLIALHYPRYLNFSHHYVFTFLVYIFIFSLWLLYTKKLSVNVQAQ
jgi:exosortase family protein XrtF